MNKNMERRWIPLEPLKRSSEGDKIFLEGYFAVFDSIYELWDGATESIAKGAFTETLKDGDIRALYNHNQDIILGRTSAGTLELKEDDHGLWGRIEINKNDSDAMNAYARSERGDITGCSFGFRIESEEVTHREDGTVHWTITKVNPLIEISPCVFPAYEETSISARKRAFEEIEKRALDLWKSKMKGRLKKHAESTDAAEEN